MPNKKTLIPLIRSGAVAALGACTVALGISSSATAAEFVDLEVPLKRSHLERSLKAAEVRDEYERAFKKAKKLDVAPKSNAAQAETGPKQLEIELDQIEVKVRKAEREPKVDSPESVGVSQGTLEAIASCESGGDPGAVSSTGDYRGKYQFDHGTWAAVGGSGDPASAPEAEQDYRAALLYSRSGSSPWPVCG